MTLWSQLFFAMFNSTAYMIDGYKLTNDFFLKQEKVEVDKSTR